MIKNSLKIRTFTTDLSREKERGSTPFSQREEKGPSLSFQTKNIYKPIL